MGFEYKDHQITELEKCMQDPMYFIDNYVMVQHYTKGTIPFELYPHQEDALNDINGPDRFFIIAAARQSGTSSMLAAYALWRLLFKSHRTVFVLVNRQVEVRAFMDIVYLMYHNLPEWLQPKLLTANKSALELSNKAKLLVQVASPNSCRGFTIDCLIWLDMAYARPALQLELLESVFPVLTSTNSKIIFASCLPESRDNNSFVHIYNAALAGVSRFKSITFKWWYVPSHDRAWKKRMISVMGKEQWNVEYELKYGKT